MAGPQFINIMTFPRQRSKAEPSETTHHDSGKRTEQRKWTVRDVVGEAARVPENSPHIDVPREPVLIFGVDPLQIPALIEADIATERARLKAKRQETGGKQIRIRQDSRVLLEEIVSCPIRVETFERSPEAAAEYERWEQNVLRDRQTYWAAQGGEVVSVNRHMDEEFMHAHIFVLPRHVPGYAADLMHPGKAAKRAVLEAGGSNKEGNTAYKTAMRGYQDHFHAAVSLRHGHSRLGPNRRRLTRSQWKAETRQMIAIAKAHQQADAYAAAARASAERDVLQAADLKEAAEQDAQLAEKLRKQAEDAKRASDALHEEALDMDREAVAAFESAEELQFQALKATTQANKDLAVAAERDGHLHAREQNIAAIETQLADRAKRLAESEERVARKEAEIVRLHTQLRDALTLVRTFTEKVKGWVRRNVTPSAFKEYVRIFDWVGIERIGNSLIQPQKQHEQTDIDRDAAPRI